MEERNNRKVLQGRVVSDKRIKYSKKYKAHDENNSAKMGDIVRIAETRPLSKDKYFRLVEIVEESIII